jgi:hypothetical protein
MRRSLLVGLLALTLPAIAAAESLRLATTVKAGDFLTATHSFAVASNGSKVIVAGWQNEHPRQLHYAVFDSNLQVLGGSAVPLAESSYGDELPVRATALDDAFYLAWSSYSGRSGMVRVDFQGKTVGEAIDFGVVNVVELLRIGENLAIILRYPCSSCDLQYYYFSPALKELGRGMLEGTTRAVGRIDFTVADSYLAMFWTEHRRTGGWLSPVVTHRDLYLSRWRLDGTQVDRIPLCVAVEHSINPTAVGHGNQLLAAWTYDWIPQLRTFPYEGAYATQVERSFFHPLWRATRMQLAKNGETVAVAWQGFEPELFVSVVPTGKELIVFPDVSLPAKIHESTAQFLEAFGNGFVVSYTDRTSLYLAKLEIVP